MELLYKFLLETLRSFEQLEPFAKPGATLITLIALLFIAWLSHLITKILIIKLLYPIFRKTSTNWDDILMKNKVFRNLSHLVPAFILYYSAHFAHPDIIDLHNLSESALNSLAKDHYLSLAGFIIKAVKIYFTFIFIFVTNSLLNSGLDIYNTTSYATHKPIKGYLQLVKILIFSLSGIIIISILIEKNPTVLLAGLGAMGAVLLLIFQDSILGFVASIQLSGNNMVKIGDWVEMKSRGADGMVIDITLNTVKIQNWDKTISTIPTYALVKESFINWKGMVESGGRRIKRAINIDMNTIKLCDSELLQRLQKFMLIRDYVIEKENDILEHNQKMNITDEDVISGRRQTNIGIFRKYIELYLIANKMISKDLTFMVRQLQPTEKGLPLEIYVFCNNTAWTVYESVQADIFDHLLAVVSEFDLRVFQEPSGSDLTNVFKITGSGRLQ